MVQLTSQELGAIGEQFVALKFVQRGARVFFPHGSLDGVDLAVEVGGRMFKVQVKTTAAGIKHEFRLRKTRDRVYEPGDLDLYACVSLDPPNVALLPFMSRSSIRIDFNNLRPEWEFGHVFEQMREGGIA